MKTGVLLSGALLWGQLAFSQGQVVFDNRANASGTYGEAPGVVFAPIYNLDPNCPVVYKEGNTASGIPAGTQTYGGPLLFNDATHQYTVTLWARNSLTVIGDAHNNNLNLVGTTTMRTSTSGTSAGRVATPAANPVVSDVVPNSTDRATFQVRVWDSRGGTLLTWDQVLQNGNVAIGYSKLFTVPYALTTTPNTPPNLEGLESFQLFLPGGFPGECVPEPSLIGLGVLAAALLVGLRRYLGKHAVA